MFYLPLSYNKNTVSVDVNSILEVNHVKIKCYVIGLFVMFTYAILSHFMDFVYSLTNECVNQFRVI